MDIKQYDDNSPNNPSIPIMIVILLMLAVAIGVVIAGYGFIQNKII